MFRSGGVSYANQTYTNPTFTGVAKGVPTILAKGGIPLIGLSSGSVSAAGAITGITALLVAYPSAYCWFPANKLATTIAAGWYYCTFSTTTAGTAFLNTYTSGIPSIPASPTAVTDGKGAFTGDTGEEFGHTITVPANALGANGELRIALGAVGTANANSKIIRVRWSTSGGTVFLANDLANLTHGGIVGAISNTGVTNKNVSKGTASPALTAASILGTIDSTAATTLVISAQRATATDNLVILPPTLEVLTDGT